jgi:hypothetical protein
MMYYVFSGSLTHHKNRSVAYCSSLYESFLWDLQLSDIARVCCAWRSAIKQIWRPPYNTHSDLVLALANNMSLCDELRRMTQTATMPV